MRRRMVSIISRGRTVDDFPHAGVTGGNEDILRSERVLRGAQLDVVNRRRGPAHRREVKDTGYAGARRPTGIQFVYVALNEISSGGDPLTAPKRQVVKDADLVAEFEQSFNKMAPDDPCTASDKHKFRHGYCPCPTPYAGGLRKCG